MKQKHQKVVINQRETRWSKMDKIVTDWKQPKFVTQLLKWRWIVERLCRLGIRENGKPYIQSRENRYVCVNIKTTLKMGYKANIQGIKRKFPFNVPCVPSTERRIVHVDPLTPREVVQYNHSTPAIKRKFELRTALGKVDWGTAQTQRNVCEHFVI